MLRNQIFAFLALVIASCVSTQIAIDHYHLNRTAMGALRGGLIVLGVVFICRPRPPPPGKLDL
jgi:uncharacterized membrane protein YkvI